MQSSFVETGGTLEQGGVDLKMIFHSRGGPRDLIF